VDAVNALGDSNGWLGSIRGQVLSRTLDSKLQESVELAAQASSAPMSVVSLMLRSTQLFRAHRGLPRELALAQATDRDLSFCQFVVRDRAMLEVNDAQKDERMPQKLVRLFGIRSYLGVPVEIDDVAVGALCVIDTVPRRFDHATKERLSSLARTASARLQDLAGIRELDPLVRVAVSPALAELRNLISVLAMGLEYSAMVASTLRPLLDARFDVASLCEQAELLEQSCEPLLDLGEVSRDVSAATQRLEALASAIGRSFSDVSTSTPIGSIVTAGLELAGHTTRCIGGVDLKEPLIADGVRCSVATGSMLVSAAASMLASSRPEQAEPRPLLVELREEPDAVVVSIECQDGSFDSTRRALWTQVSAARLDDEQHSDAVSVSLTEHGIELRFLRGCAN